MSHTVKLVKKLELEGSGSLGKMCEVDGSDWNGLNAWRMVSWRGRVDDNFNKGPERCTALIACELKNMLLIYSCTL